MLVPSSTSRDRPQTALSIARKSPALRLAYRRLPDRLLLTPMAYHRTRYERLAASYHDMGLADFGPDREVVSALAG